MSSRTSDEPSWVPPVGEPLDEERARLLVRWLRTHGPPVAEDQPTPLDQLLRLQFISVAGGTAKLVLDATLAGYYTQAFALIRHLFETWLRIVYLDLFPHMADAWYVDEVGRPPRPPNENTIRRQIRKAADEQTRRAVEMVVKTVDRLNVMARPSPNTLQQTVGVRPNQYNVGANYDPDLAVGALHEGASALRLLLSGLNHIVPQRTEWIAALRAAMNDHQSALAAEVKAQETRSGRDINQHSGDGGRNSEAPERNNGCTEIR